MVEQDYSSWFHEHLRTSADGLVWAARLVPPDRWDVTPPPGLGEWTAARHAFHMLYYEQRIALPSMRQWLGASLPVLDDFDEDEAWNTRSHEIEPLLAAFKQVRAEQIALLQEFDDAAWLAPRETVWAPLPLLWVVGKTYQHTAEHISDVLRIALFWEGYLANPPE